MRNLNDLIKLSRYYMEKQSTKETNFIDATAQDKGELTTKNNSQVTSNVNDVKETTILENNTFIMNALSASFKLLHIKKMIHGSELAFSLHEQQRKSYKEFTPEHSKSIEILSKINQNLKALRAEEINLNLELNKFEKLYKTKLNIYEIE